MRTIAIAATSVFGLTSCSKRERQTEPVPSAASVAPPVTLLSGVAKPVSESTAMVPTILAPLHRVGQLVVDDRWVYASSRQGSADEDTLYRVPKTGGVPTLVGTPQRSLYGFRSIGDKLVILSKPVKGDGALLWSMPTRGGAPRHLVDPRADTTSFVADERSVYFFAGKPTATSAQTLNRLPLAGGSIEALCTSPEGSQPAPLANDAAHVYWSTARPHDSGATLVGIPVGDPKPVEPTVLARVEGRISAIASDGAHAYFIASATEPDGTPRGSLWRATIPRSGSAGDAADAERLVEHLVAPSPIAVDDEAVYWVDAGALMKRDKKTGASKVLASTRLAGSDLAIDDQFVYWADERLGVARVPKN